MRPWAGFRVLRPIWLGGLCCVVALAPILFSDIMVMIPCTMAFLFAGGPVLAYAKEPPTCRSCGLARPHPGWHETPCRPVRLAESERPPTPLRIALSAAPVVAESSEEESGVRPLPTAERNSQ